MKVSVVGVPGMKISVVNKVIALKVAMHDRNNCYPPLPPPKKKGGGGEAWLKSPV